MTILERLQVKARELARSGKFHGCRPIAFELRFGAGYEEAREWLQAAATLVFASLAVWQRWSSSSWTAYRNLKSEGLR